MSYSVEGDYFETCNCTVACQCIMLSPATNDSCQAFFAWHITRGKKDGVDLSGLNVAFALYSPKQMTDGSATKVLGTSKGLVRTASRPSSSTRHNDWPVRLICS